MSHRVDRIVFRAHGFIHLNGEAEPWIADSGRETDHPSVPKLRAVDLDLQTVKPNSPHFSGDKPAKGPLGLLHKQLRFDFPLCEIIFRSEHLLVKDVLRMLRDKSLPLKGLLIARTVAVSQLLLSNRNSADLIRPAHCERSTCTSSFRGLGKEPTQCKNPSLDDHFARNGNRP